MVMDPDCSEACHTISVDVIGGVGGYDIRGVNGHTMSVEFQFI